MCFEYLILYHFINKLKKKNRNISSIENPVEFKIEGVNQIQTKESIGFDFEYILKSVLRQDPDIIFIGEIRDSKTAKIAIRAANTGHLVISTIHSKDSVSVISRLRDFDVENNLIESSLIGIASQRLIRILCEKCKIQNEIIDYEILNEFNNKNNIKTNVGCEECLDGFSERRAIMEVYAITNDIAELIAKGYSEHEIRLYINDNQQNYSLKQNGITCLENGITTIEEIMEKIYE